MNDAEPPQPTLTGDEFFPVPETPAPAPPPPPEDGAALLDEVCDAIARYVILPSAAETTAAALWAACTHAQPAWEFASRLVIKAPLKQCGKSRLLNVMEALSYNAVATINISPAALVHEIGDDPPSLFLDEADVTFRRRGGETSETAELLRGILNGGAERGKPYIRRNHAARCNERVSTFCMVAAAGIGDWAPDTLEDRAIIVSMRRRGPGESVAPLRRRDLPALHQLRERLHQWARAHLDELRAAVPEMPVQDRDADVWEPPRRPRPRRPPGSGFSRTSARCSATTGSSTRARSWSGCTPWKRRPGATGTGTCCGPGTWPGCCGPTASARRSSARAGPGSR